MADRLDHKTRRLDQLAPALPAEHPTQRLGQRPPFAPPDEPTQPLTYAHPGSEPEPPTVVHPAPREVSTPVLRLESLSSETLLLAHEGVQLIHYGWLFFLRRHWREGETVYTMQIGSHDWQNWLADVHDNKFLYDPGYQPYWATRKRTLDDPAGYWYASAITGLGSQIKIGRNADLTEQRLQEVWYKTSRFVGQRAEQ